MAANQPTAPALTHMTAAKRALPPPDAPRARCNKHLAAVGGQQIPNSFFPDSPDVRHNSQRFGLPLVHVAPLNANF